jgi:hypothetical protein
MDCFTESLCEEHQLFLFLIPRSYNKQTSSKAPTPTAPGIRSPAAAAGRFNVQSKPAVRGAGGERAAVHSICKANGKTRSTPSTHKEQKHAFYCFLL